VTKSKSQPDFKLPDPNKAIAAFHSLSATAAQSAKAPTIGPEMKAPVIACKTHELIKQNEPDPTFLMGNDKQKNHVLTKYQENFGNDPE